MPFQSEKQRRYLWANEPEIAQRWEHEMKDTPEGYSNARNFDEDTYTETQVESMMPFVTSDPDDPHTEATWGQVADADFAATPMDIVVHGDGSVTTRAKAGQANQTGAGVNPTV